MGSNRGVGGDQSDGIGEKPRDSRQISAPNFRNEEFLRMVFLKFRALVSAGRVQRIEPAAFAAVRSGSGAWARRGFQLGQ